MDVPISLMGSLMNLYLKRNWTHTKLLTAVTPREQGWDRAWGGRHLSVFIVYTAVQLDFFFFQVLSSCYFYYFKETA